LNLFAEKLLFDEKKNVGFTSQELTEIFLDLFPVSSESELAVGIKRRREFFFLASDHLAAK